jgi:hypothetical protein
MVLHHRPNDGSVAIFMRCVARQDITIDPIWRIYIGYKNLQKIVVKVHEKIVDHMNSVAHWEVVYFSQRVNAPRVIQGLNIIIDIEQSTIIIVIKTLCFII